MCNLDDYEDVREDDPNKSSGEPFAQLSIAEGTPAGMTMRVKLQPCMEPDPNQKPCCNSNAGATQGSTTGSGEEFEQTPGPQELLESGMINWAKCMNTCGPRLPAYCCKGVIK